MACCVGGHGRTGTTLACLMVAGGLTADEAIHRVRTTYGKKAAETSVQEKYVGRVYRATERSQGMLTPIVLFLIGFADLVYGLFQGGPTKR